MTVIVSRKCVHTFSICEHATQPLAILPYPNAPQPQQFVTLSGNTFCCIVLPLYHMYFRTPHHHHHRHAFQRLWHMHDQKHLVAQVRRSRTIVSACVRVIHHSAHIHICSHTTAQSHAHDAHGHILFLLRFGQAVRVRVSSHRRRRRPSSIQTKFIHAQAKRTHNTKRLDCEVCVSTWI